MSKELIQMNTNTNVTVVITFSAVAERQDDRRNDRHDDDCLDVTTRQSIMEDAWQSARGFTDPQDDEHPNGRLYVALEVLEAILKRHRTA